MKTIFTALMLLAATTCAASDSICYRASLTANASTGRMAPYLIGSMDGGRITGANGVWQSGCVSKDLRLDKRLSWGAGIEYMLGYGSRVTIDRAIGAVGLGQAPARIQQLYGELKWRGVSLIAGMKDARPLMVDADLSSGDLTLSGNARPVPGVDIGFVDFQNIPFTNGWVQIEGRVAFGKMTDTRYSEKAFGYNNGLLATHLYYAYKRCYFRTHPGQPLSVTVGMQTGGLFGGTSRYYRHGKVIKEDKRGFTLKQMWEMLVPTTGEDYFSGSSLGSWDFRARYRFHSGAELSAYFEWPWEDGSGIGRRNGWDGLWGLQFNMPQSGVIDKIVVEYLDFTNQSGPIHFSPDDFNGTDIVSQATGGDDYYNNAYYGPWTNYGMSLGSPFIIAPAYNTDGRLAYLHNRARGFHIAAQGSPTSRWTYRAAVSYQRAGGSGRMPAPHRMSDTSAMLSAWWIPVPKLPGLSLKAQVAFDAGKLRGNNFGALVGITYSGLINL